MGAQSSKTQYGTLAYIQTLPPGKTDHGHLLCDSMKPEMAEQYRMPFHVPIDPFGPNAQGQRNEWDKAIAAHVEWEKTHPDRSDALVNETQYTGIRWGKRIFRERTVHLVIQIDKETCGQVNSTCLSTAVEAAKDGKHFSCVYLNNRSHGKKRRFPVEDVDPYEVAVKSGPPGYGEGLRLVGFHPVSRRPVVNFPAPRFQWTPLEIYHYEDSMEETLDQIYAAYDKFSIKRIPGAAKALSKVPILGDFIGSLGPLDLLGLVPVVGPAFDVADVALMAGSLLNGIGTKEKALQWAFGNVDGSRGAAVVVWDSDVLLAIKHHMEVQDMEYYTQYMRLRNFIIMLDDGILLTFHYDEGRDWYMSATADGALLENYLNFWLGNDRFMIVATGTVVDETKQETASFRRHWLSKGTANIPAPTARGLRPLGTDVPWYTMTDATATVSREEYVHGKGYVLRNDKKPVPGDAQVVKLAAEYLANMRAVPCRERRMYFVEANSFVLVDPGEYTLTKGSVRGDIEIKAGTEPEVVVVYLSRYGVSVGGRADDVRTVWYLEDQTDRRVGPLILQDILADEPDVRDGKIVYFPVETAAANAFVCAVYAYTMPYGGCVACDIDFGPDGVDARFYENYINKTNAGRIIRGVIKVDDETNASIVGYVRFADGYLSGVDNADLCDSFMTIVDAIEGNVWPANGSAVQVLACLPGDPDGGFGDLVPLHPYAAQRNILRAGVFVATFDGTEYTFKLVGNAYWQSTTPAGAVYENILNLDWFRGAADESNGIDYCTWQFADLPIFLRSWRRADDLEATWQPADNENAAVLLQSCDPRAPNGGYRPVRTLAMVTTAFRLNARCASGALVGTSGFFKDPTRQNMWVGNTTADRMKETVQNITKSDVTGGLSTARTYFRESSGGTTFVRIVKKSDDSFAFASVEDEMTYRRVKCTGDWKGTDGIPEGDAWITGLLNDKTRCEAILETPPPVSETAVVYRHNYVPPEVAAVTTTMDEDTVRATFPLEWERASWFAKEIGLADVRSLVQTGGPAQGLAVEALFKDPAWELKNPTTYRDLLLKHGGDAFVPKTAKADFDLVNCGKWPEPASMRRGGKWCLDFADAIARTTGTGTAPVPDLVAHATKKGLDYRTAYYELLKDIDASNCGNREGACYKAREAGGIIEGPKAPPPPVAAPTSAIATDYTPSAELAAKERADKRKCEVAGYKDCVRGSRANARPENVVSYGPVGKYDMKRCADMCQMDGTCRAFHWTGDKSRDCYLFTKPYGSGDPWLDSTVATTLEDTVSANKIAAPATCQVAGLDQCALGAGAAEPSRSIGTYGGVENAEGCRDAMVREGGQSLAYDPGAKTCVVFKDRFWTVPWAGAWRHRGGEGNTGITANRPAPVGAFAPPPPPPPEKKCSLPKFRDCKEGKGPRVDTPANTISYNAIPADKQRCMDMCTMDGACASFFWSDNQCRLLTKTLDGPGMERIDTAPGSVSANKDGLTYTCDLSGAAQCAYATQVGTPGERWQATFDGVQTAEECARRMGTTALAMSMVYDPNAKSCQLYKDRFWARNYDGAWRAGGEKSDKGFVTANANEHNSDQAEIEAQIAQLSKELFGR